jgi:superfamily II DNA helicase RecQ
MNTELRTSVEESRLQLKLLYLAPETFYQPYAQEIIKVEAYVFA